MSVVRLTFFDMSDDLLKFFNCHQIVTVNRLSFDNAQSHVTAFRPVSEAARSWSDDNEILMNSRLKISHEGAARVGHFQPRVIIF